MLSQGGYNLKYLSVTDWGQYLLNIRCSRLAFYSSSCLGYVSFYMVGGGVVIGFCAPYLGQKTYLGDLTCCCVQHLACVKRLPLLFVLGQKLLF